MGKLLFLGIYDLNNYRKAPDPGIIEKVDDLDYSDKKAVEKHREEQRSLNVLYRSPEAWWELSKHKGNPLKDKSKVVELLIDDVVHRVADIEDWIEENIAKTVLILPHRVDETQVIETIKRKKHGWGSEEIVEEVEELVYDTSFAFIFNTEEEASLFKLTWG